MVTEATRRARPSLSALVAILLALIAGPSVPALVVSQVGPTSTASADATRHSGATVPAVAVEPPADAGERTPGVHGCERALCTQLVTAVHAARAPPTTTV